MKAVLLVLTATLVVGIFGIKVWAAEPELSIDLFGGKGEVSSGPIENIIVPSFTPRESPSPSSSPTPFPPTTAEPTFEPTPEPTPTPTDEPRKIKNRSDLYGILLNFRYPIGRFRPSLELGFGNEDGNGWKEDFSLTEIKAGYAIAENKKWRVEPYLSFLKLKAGGGDINGPMLGLDLRYQLSPRFSLDGGIGFAIAPDLEYESESFDEEFLNQTRLKLIYHLNQSTDLGLGYRIYRFSGDANAGNIATVKGKYDLFTLGFTYKWGSKPKPSPEPTPIPEEKPPVIEPKPEATVEPKPEPQPDPKPLPLPEPEPEPTVEPKPAPPPEPLTPILVVKRLLKPIFFDFDQASLREDQREVLDQNIQVLKDYPELFILVGGHADSRGKKNYNINLSQRRTKTVVDYLVANGLDPAKITSFAYGEEYPYQKYETNPAWESDRWVDILVSEKPPTWEFGIENRGILIELE